MKNYVLRIIAVVFTLIFSLGLAAPAQASSWSLNQTPSWNPGCTKNWLGWPNCDRANAWGITASIGLDAVRQNNESNRATAMKSAIVVVAAPLGSPSRIEGVSNRIGNRLTVNQGLCVKEELQRSTNRLTAKSELVKNYYSYLDRTYKYWKQAPLARGYQSVLKGSKGVAIKVMNDTEIRNLEVGLTACGIR